MAPELTIRPAQRKDLPALGRLGALLIRTHHDFDAARFMPPREGAEEGYAHFLGGELDASRVVLLVAERDRAILGYVYAGIEPRSWKELRDAAGFIHDVVVEPSARGEGIAGRLVEAAADWLEKRGAPRVMLWTAQGNVPAQRLFERLGFRRTMIEMTRERRGP